MEEKGKHLTAEERIEIYALRKAGFSGAAIGRKIGRDASVVNREIKRNSGKKGYRPKQAHQLAMARRRKPRTSKATSECNAYVEEKLREDWSPEQISNRMEKSLGFKLSHEYIYQYILADKRNGGMLYRHLRIANGTKRRKRYGKRDYRGRIPQRVDIEERPSIVASRRRYGDWEADLVCGRHHQGFLVTLVERKSRTVLIGHCRHKTKDEVTAEILRLFSRCSLPVKTITFDNGREFSGHWRIRDTLGCKTYFATPYHSWERGANENMNGLIRQYFHKKADLRSIRRTELWFVEDRLNNRPRKVLAYMTPNEIVSRRA